MGIFDAFKKSRREVIRDNQHQGKSGEEKIKRDWEFDGYKVKNTGRGHDLKAQKRDWLTGKKETKYIEVKTGNSPLSKLQKRRKRQMGSKYVVERLEPTPFGFVYNNKSKDKPKKSSSNFDALFGTSSSSKRKKSSSFDSLFGSGSSGKRKKSRSTYDGIWGSTSSGKKRKSKSSYDSIWSSGSSRRRKKSSIW